MKRFTLLLFLPILTATACGKPEQSTAPEEPFCDSVCLYRPGDYGSANWRIPALLCLDDGTLLAINDKRKYNETDLPYECIVKGDAKFMTIAAASILAKTYRDEIMCRLHQEYPLYGWDHNKGYPTADHYRAIEQHGISPYHRRSFSLYKQHTLFE